MSDDPYVYPGTNVLRNKLNIRDAGQLDKAERLLVTQRMREGVPKGKFDLQHLQAIHRHLFQDVYEWAGKVRTVEIAKGTSRFQPKDRMETGMADVHRRLVQERLLRNKPLKTFSHKAAEILGDVNYVHPFREGNGRTQMLYLQQLAEQAGYTLDLSKIDPVQWIEASSEAHQARYEAMATCIEGSLQPQLHQGRSR